MPRAPRINFEGALYYVTNRGLHAQKLFADGEDYLMYLELAGKYKKQRPFKLFAFALMPEHLHLLIETTAETSISDIMHNITSSYTKYYNKKYNRQGHLFRGRFRATVVEKEPYLARLIRYIHRNPVTMGLASDMRAWSYSSYLNYAGGSPETAQRIDCAVEISEVMTMLAGKTFDDFMSESEPAQEDERLHKNLQGKMHLGSEEFGQKIHEMLQEATAAKEEPQAGVRRLVVPAVSGLVLAAVAGSILLTSHGKAGRRMPAVAPTPVVKSDAQEIQEEVAFELVGLDGSIWQIKFVAGTPFQTIDNLTFKDGKMASENLGLNGYPASNYSTTTDGDRVVWETMQTSGAGTASWRGEVEAGKMRGILSLRPKDVPSEVEGRPSKKEPQDFSFVSMKYKKYKTKDEGRKDEGRK